MNMFSLLSKAVCAIAAIPFFVTGLMGCSRNVDRTADKIVIKVAVVLEDPKLAQFDFKRVHECCTTPGYSFAWHDPRQQMLAFQQAINEVSHGVVEYEIVEVIDADTLFTYKKDSPIKQHISKDEFAQMLVLPEWGVNIERNIAYDYNSMIAYYGFDTKCDSGLLDEVWIYSTPLSGAYESHLMGKGAFWLNSPPETQTSCNELLTVMFFNYERDLACALESFSHRFESTMMQVYGWWDYDHKSSKSELTTWERYTGYALVYDRFDSGNSNIGNVHFPPNGTHDYDFMNSNQVMSYADEWLNYPDVPEKRARAIDCSEWGSHEGYMRWWLSHMPHFKGINPNDGKLNNWWHYVVRYNEALGEEQSAKNQKQ